jgi:hypothetical protein
MGEDGEGDERRRQSIASRITTIATSFARSADQDQAGGEGPFNDSTSVVTRVISRPTTIEKRGRQPLQVREHRVANRDDIARPLEHSEAQPEPATRHDEQRRPARSSSGRRSGSARDGAFEQIRLHELHRETANSTASDSPTRSDDARRPRAFRSSGRHGLAGTPSSRPRGRPAAGSRHLSSHPEQVPAE